MRLKEQHNCVSYLDDLINPAKRKKTIARVVKFLKHFDTICPFDAIAMSGTSGMLLGATVADRLHKNLIVVRKSDDKSTHSCYKVEGVYSKRYVVIDDLIASGKTLAHILNTITAVHQPKCGHECKCVGVYLYQQRVTDEVWDSEVYLTKEQIRLVIPNCTDKLWNLKWAATLPQNFWSIFAPASGMNQSAAGSTMKTKSSPSPSGMVASSSAINAMTGVQKSCEATKAATTLGQVNPTASLPAMDGIVKTRPDQRLSVKEFLTAWQSIAQG